VKSNSSAELLMSFSHHFSPHSSAWRSSAAETRNSS